MSRVGIDRVATNTHLHILTVDTIPLTGRGKTDHAAKKNLAMKIVSLSDSVE